MAFPENFSLNTDYTALKNDGNNTIELNITTGMTIPSNGQYTWFRDYVIGKKNASVRALMNTSREPSDWNVGTSLSVDLRVRYNTTGSPEGDEGNMVSIVRIAPNVIRIYMTYTNVQSFSVTILGYAQTITARIATFLSPFE